MEGLRLKFVVIPQDSRTLDYVWSDTKLPEGLEKSILEAAERISLLFPPTDNIEFPDIVLGRNSVYYIKEDQFRVDPEKTDEYSLGSLAAEWFYFRTNENIFKMKNHILKRMNEQGLSEWVKQNYNSLSVYTNLIHFVKHYCGIYYANSMVHARSSDIPNASSYMPKTDEARELIFRCRHRGMIAAERLQPAFDAEIFRGIVTADAKSAANYIRDLAHIDISC